MVLGEPAAYRDTDPAAPDLSTPGDGQLLDAYSQTVAAVVGRVAPSLVNIRVASGESRPGSGSGFILTNSHVVHGVREPEVTRHDAHTLPRGWSH